MNVSAKRRGTFSVSPENVPRVYFLLHVIQTGVVTVRDDGFALPLEFLQVIDYPAAEEGAAVCKGRFVDDHFGALRLDPLHNSLDAALAEVVAVRLHRQAVNPYSAALLLRRVVVSPVVVVVVARFGKNPVRYEVFPRAVALNYSLDKVLRNVSVVRQELFGVFRQTVTAISETRIIIKVPYSRVEAHAPDDVARVEALHLRVGIKLVEVADTQGKVCVREQLYSLRFRKAHVKGLYILLDGAFLKKRGEPVRRFIQSRVPLRSPHDDAARVEVVIQRLALPQKLG